MNARSGNDQADEGGRLRREGKRIGTDRDGPFAEAIFQRWGYDFRNYARASIERRVRRFLAVAAVPGSRS